MAQDKGAPAELDAHTVKTLLDKLERDDGFRAQFQAAPGQALRSIGYTGSIECMTIEGPLASPEQIRSQRGKLELAMVGVQKQSCPLAAQEGF